MIGTSIIAAALWLIVSSLVGMAVVFGSKNKIVGVLILAVTCGLAWLAHDLTSEVLRIERLAALERLDS